jgi:hypothetical protein
MKIKTEILFKVVGIQIVCAGLISSFNSLLAAFFCFGAAVTGFLYTYFGLIKKNVKPEKKPEKELKGGLK